MNSLNFILKVSRPRFWLYVFGPYIVGLISGAVDKPSLFAWKTILFAFYFLLPANLLIYAVNDIFDQDTDKLNEKKSEYEVRIEERTTKGLWIAVVCTNLPFVIVSGLLLPDTFAPLLGFLFFAIFYSAPPVRAKSKPFLDSAFNILYIFPAVLGFKLLSGEYPPALALLAAGCWTAAMHAYSAIPDIEADHAAGISTVATFLGAKGTLIFCSILYGAAAVISFAYLSYLSVAIGAIYLLMTGWSFTRIDSDRIFAIYRWFPLINSVSGFLLFWFIALNRFVL